MPSPNLRYIVLDVQAAVDFYTRHFEFKVVFQPGPGFAILARGDLRVAFNEVGGPGGASQHMPDGRSPEPGGWNRMILEVGDMEAVVSRLREGGVTFRSPVISGVGGKLALAEDPSSNLIELFEPKQ
jgi:catechol 2,3-dioxygenase-like lactoylglutathione lyase family enzyme